MLQLIILSLHSQRIPANPDDANLKEIEIRLQTLLKDEKEENKGIEDAIKELQSSSIEIDKLR